jgi:pimeloyl-ACP methyl ester carboxylesterase
VCLLKTRRPQSCVQDIPLASGDAAYGLVSETAERLELLGKVPMLICWGLRDFMFDAQFLAEWERRFPDAEVHRFTDAGHYVLEDAADEIVPLVRAFLAARAAVGVGHGSAEPA